MTIQALRGSYQNEQDWCARLPQCADRKSDEFGLSRFWYVCNGEEKGFRCVCVCVCWGGRAECWMCSIKMGSPEMVRRKMPSAWIQMSLGTFWVEDEAEIAQDHANIGGFHRRVRWLRACFLIYWISWLLFMECFFFAKAIGQAIGDENRSWRRRTSNWNLVFYSGIPHWYLFFEYDIFSYTKQTKF